MEKSLSTVTPTPDSLPIVLPYQPARWSVADYHKLIADGALTKNRRLELLKGVMVEKKTNNPAHAGLVARLQRMISKLLQENYVLRTQLPITLSDSEPEPDLAIVRPGPLELERHPSPPEILLVIESAYPTVKGGQSRIDNRAVGHLGVLRSSS
jgi:hypothetical protein